VHVVDTATDTVLGTIAEAGGTAVTMSGRCVAAPQPVGPSYTG